MTNSDIRYVGFEPTTLNHTFKETHTFGRFQILLIARAERAAQTAGKGVRPPNRLMAVNGEKVNLSVLWTPDTDAILEEMLRDENGEASESEDDESSASDRSATDMSDEEYEVTHTQIRRVTATRRSLSYTYVVF